jgi:hypothetical protein
MAELNSAENQLISSQISDNCLCGVVFSQYVPSTNALQISLLGLQFANVQLQQLTTRQDPVWNDVLRSIVDGQTHDIWDWRALGQQFGVTVTQVVAIAQSSFCFALSPLAPLPLDRQ